MPRVLDRAQEGVMIELRRVDRVWADEPAEDQRGHVPATVLVSRALVEDDEDVTRRRPR
jgi:hypothetical protein